MAHFFRSSKVFWWVAVAATLLRLFSSVGRNSELVDLSLTKFNKTLLVVIVFDKFEAVESSRPVLPVGEVVGEIGEVVAFSSMFEAN